MKVKSLIRVRLLVTTWTAVYQAPPSMGFSRQEYRSGVPLSVTVSNVSPSICHEVIGSDAIVFVFLMLSFKPTFSLSTFTFYIPIDTEKIYDLSGGRGD